MKAKGRILEWGNSWGIRLDKRQAKASGLQPNQEVEVEVKKKITTGRDIWGTLKTKVNTAKALREIDEMFPED